MVQSVSQYEFIYEYILDYLCQQNLIDAKFPRNTFGLEADDDEESNTNQELMLGNQEDED